MQLGNLQESWDLEKKMEVPAGADESVLARKKRKRFGVKGFSYLALVNEQLRNQEER
jgi:hypothetical protein